MGAGILAASVVGVAVYAVLLYSYALVVLQITAFVAVAGVLVVMAWIGWTMATTPPPAPIEISETSADLKPAGSNRPENQQPKESG